ncbi:MAG: glutaredoxin family protein [Pseudomonadales bacterium]|nr:glutaredoxin family protein [Pseudomonadales bacterium]
MSVKRQIILYSRQDCHLCDQAQVLIEQVISGSDWQLEKVDIDSDPKLTELYRYSIPVLARIEDTKTTALNWPFPPSRIKDLLKD